MRHVFFFTFSPSLDMTQISLYRRVSEGTKSINLLDHVNDLFMSKILFCLLMRSIHLTHLPPVRRCDFQSMIFK